MADERSNAHDIKVKRRKISDYQLDTANPNKGSVRGSALLETSVDSFGPARSGVVDRDGVIRAGNHTAQQLMDAGIEDVIEIESDGHEWIVVRRTDMTPEDGKLYAVADNRTGQFIEWDADVLRTMQDEHIKIEDYFKDGELKSLLGKLPDAGDAAKDAVPEVYGVLIECSTEEEQTAILNRLLSEGIQCKALLS